jgi:endogenous inhibitor of DNA gyrase (YacG/DUF329 family)
MNKPYTPATMAKCKRCGEPFEPRRKNQLFCSERHKKEWEAGKRLLVNQLEQQGIINADSIDAVLRAAGGAEGAL